MLSQKVITLNYSSFPRKRESWDFRQLQAGWIPAFAGMTTFCGCINFSLESVLIRLLCSIHVIK